VSFCFHSASVFVILSAVFSAMTQLHSADFL
jgi:hypothetical protein